MSFHGISCFFVCYGEFWCHMRPSEMPEPTILFVIFRKMHYTNRNENGKWQGASVLSCVRRRCIA